MNKNFAKIAISQNNNTNTIDEIKICHQHIDEKYDILQNKFDNFYIDSQKLLKINNKYNEMLINNQQFIDTNNKLIENMLKNQSILNNQLLKMNKDLSEKYDDLLQKYNDIIKNK